MVLDQQYYTVEALLSSSQGTKNAYRIRCDSASDAIASANMADIAYEFYITDFYGA